MSKFKFKIEKKLDGLLGRAGTYETPHGVINTPAFAAVGTKATVKSLNPDQIKETGTEVVLGNTYHLYLQPGDEVVKKAGGLGSFMNWRGPTMTDSGGFQVFSLGAAYGKGISKIVKITDPSLMIPERFDDSDAPRLATIGNDGVSFKSHLDGSLHYITPEKSIEIQHNLGADIIFAFDECTSPTEDLRYQEEALNRTHRWAERSLKRHLELNALRQAQGKQGIALFGIVQGGRDEQLRKISAKAIAEMRMERVDPVTGEASFTGFDGFGIGGSFAKEDMSTAVKWVNEILPEEKPRHLLGIGEPEDLFMGIENGVDFFDCVLPTRLGRTGTIFTSAGKINIENAKYREDFTPIEEDCGCYSCNGYTKVYIAHLFHGKEMLAGTLASIHNLYFIVNLVKNIRNSILDGTFHKYKEDFLKKYNTK